MRTLNSAPGYLEGLCSSENRLRGVHLCSFINSVVARQGEYLRNDADRMLMIRSYEVTKYPNNKATEILHFSAIGLLLLRN